MKMHGLPKLSIVVPGERSETVRRIGDALRRQTVREALEVIVVRWPGDWEAPDLREDGYAAVRIILVPASTTLPEARAAGARAATAPLLFFAETHAYPRPEWASAVLEAAASGAWDVISSSFVNANPVGAVSWAGFLLDYGAFAEDAAAGEIGPAPIHKGTFPRDGILALGERLVAALSAGDELGIALQAQGRRTYFEPRAAIAHYNVRLLGLWLRGRFLIGFQIGANRAERWSAARRAAYVVLSPLIAAVLAWRTWPIARRVGRCHPLPNGTSLAILAGSATRAAGEAVGYACGRLPSLQAKADAYELFESVYCGCSEP
jgi:hypothetical protein